MTNAQRVRTNLVCGVLVFMVFMLFNGNAFADQFHYNNLLIGDRASGMGGAYTAVSDDATGLYYNPAGIVYSSGRNLSASVNAFYNLTKKYDGVIGGHGWERNSSALLPNYFGIIQPLGKFKFGFSYAVPDSINEDQDQTFYNLTSTTSTLTINSYVINFNNEDNTYNYGPTIAMELSKSLSAGMTLYVHQRSAQLILNQLVDTTSGYEWSNKYFEIHETGVRPIIGIMWSPVDKISIGLALSKTFLLSSTTTDQVTYSVDGLTPPSGLPQLQPALWRKDASASAKKEYPLQINTGVSYFASSDLLLTTELSYFTKTNDPVFGDRDAVLNAAIGAEYFVNRNWALRGGFYTNQANTPDIKAGVQSVAEEHIDLFGGTLSLSHFTRNTSVTLGGSMSYGTGKAQITGDPNLIQNASTFGWTLALSSSYSY